MENSPYSSPLVNSSLSTPASDPDSMFSLCPTHATLTFLTSMYALLFLTGLPGNALSLWVFLHCIRSRTPTHVYLGHLSFSNLLLVLTTPFLAAYYAGGLSWPLDGLACQLVLHVATPVLHVNIYIGVALLTWVALNRFSTLIQHTHATRPSACTSLLPPSVFASLKKTSVARAVCATIWVLSLGAIVPVTVYYSKREVMRAEGRAGGARQEVCYSPEVEIGGSLSRASTVVGVAFFFVCFLLVQMCYMTVLRHIRRSSRSTKITDSQRMMARVFRNIVVIQVVLVVCLLPHHIFKPIFVSLVQQQLTVPAPSHTTNHHCHPLSGLVELKNCLLLLTAVRASADPVMYFLLDRAFHKHAISLFRCGTQPSGSHFSGSTSDKANERIGALGQGQKSFQSSRGTSL